MMNIYEHIISFLFQHYHLTLKYNRSDLLFAPLFPHKLIIININHLSSDL
jgi:hypothetical protein